MKPEQAPEYLRQCAELQRRNSRGANFSLAPVQKIAEALSNPQDRYPSIHIAGTNGKGSTCAMLEAIYRHAGYTTGLYTSPHLIDITERIQINRQPISPRDFSAGIQKINQLESLLPAPLSFFEILTLLAFLHFAQSKVEVAIIETGLGGRLDATNILKPTITTITTIAHDHTEYLGPTLGHIAAEKAGILKPAAPLVLGQVPPEALEVILQKAEALQVNVHHAHAATQRPSTPSHHTAETPTNEPPPISTPEHANASATPASEHPSTPSHHAKAPNARASEHAAAATPSHHAATTPANEHANAPTPEHAATPAPERPSTPSHHANTRTPEHTAADTPSHHAAATPTPEHANTPTNEPPPIPRPEHPNTPTPRPEDYPASNLEGEHQRRNAAVAKLLAELNPKLPAPTPKIIAEALQNVRWRARWESLQLGDGQRIILEAAHNAEGAHQLASQLARHVKTHGKAIIAVGTLGVERARPLMEQAARYASALHLLCSANPRATPTHELRQCVPSHFNGLIIESSLEALFPEPDTCSLPKEKHLILTGSLQLIGEALARIQGRHADPQDMLQPARKPKVEPLR